jgi:hypothetical protein
MSASGTVTATGISEALASKEVSASATVTATGTSEILKTKDVSASGSVTASGTGSIDAVFVFGGAGTVTATGSVDFSIRPPITLQSNGTVIADSSGAMAKTMPYESTGTATATSQAGATHTYYIFKPPTREISPLSLDPYYQLVGYHQGRTLVKRDGVWKLVQNRQEDWLDQCEYVFKGGCENRVNGTQKAELESAGYTVETRTS